MWSTDLGRTELRLYVLWNLTQKSKTWHFSWTRGCTPIQKKHHSTSMHPADLHWVPHHSWALSWSPHLAVSTLLFKHFTSKNFTFVSLLITDKMLLLTRSFLISISLAFLQAVQLLPSQNTQAALLRNALSQINVRQSAILCRQFYIWKHSFGQKQKLFAF